VLTRRFATRHRFGRDDLRGWPTLHELEHLWPRLAPRGVLIIDDYGHWQGARKAVDEYFGKQPQRPMLHRADYSGRTAIKPG
jgi:O-methyltransferase